MSRLGRQGVSKRGRFNLLKASAIVMERSVAKFSANKGNISEILIVVVFPLNVAKCCGVAMLCIKICSNSMIFATSHVILLVRLVLLVGVGQIVGVLLLVLLPLLLLIVRPFLLWGGSGSS